GDLTGARLRPGYVASGEAVAGTGEDVEDAPAVGYAPVAADGSGVLPVRGATVRASEISQERCRRTPGGVRLPVPGEQEARTGQLLGRVHDRLPEGRGVRAGVVLLADQR